MKNLSWIFLLLFIAGLVILLLPDSGNRVIEFNEKHGPSVLDLLGLTMIVVAWGYSCLLIVKNWKKIADRFGRINILLLGTVYIISTAGIALSLVLSLESLLWSSVTIALVINLIFIVPAIRNE